MGLYGKSIFYKQSCVRPLIIFEYNEDGVYPIMGDHAQGV